MAFMDVFIGYKKETRKILIKQNCINIFDQVVVYKLYVPNAKHKLNPNLEI